MLSGIVLLSLVTLANSQVLKCLCSSPELCEHVDDWHKDRKEVFVAATKSQDYEKWMWDSFTTVIEWADSPKTELMCHAHSLKKKYGFYLESFPQSLNASSHEVVSYINVTRTDIEIQRADVLAVNLVDYLGNCTYAGEHVEGIYNVTTTVIKGIKNGTTTKVLCVMPWKPPCYNSDCMITPALAKVCDGLILSPKSYNTYCEESCTAKATVSYSKVTIGLTEYLAAGFSSSQLILGIPWHGYNYTCKQGDHMDNLTDHFVCHLMKNENGTCNLEGSRKKESIETMVGAVPEIALIDATYSKTDQTPWKVDKVGNQTYMTWFEDVGSLMSKYGLVDKYSLKGVIVFSAEDLTYDKDKIQFTDTMWMWLLHQVLSTGQGQEPTQPKINMAGTVAAVGVGLFIMGCIFGILVSCVILRKKKPLRPPFSQDPSPADEYTDDDDHHRPTQIVYSDHNKL